MLSSTRWNRFDFRVFAFCDWTSFQAFKKINLMFARSVIATCKLEVFLTLGWRRSLFCPIFAQRIWVLHEAVAICMKLHVILQSRRVKEAAATGWQSCPPSSDPDPDEWWFLLLKFSSSEMAVGIVRLSYRPLRTMKRFNNLLNC